MYTLSDQDVKVLREVVNDYRRRNRTGDPIVPLDGATDNADEYMTPEVYVAEIPTNGIAGIDYSGTTPFQPASANCTIFKLFPEASSPFDIELAEQIFTRKVYNISADAVEYDASDRYRLVIKDKWGKWIVVQAGGGKKRYGFANSGISAATKSGSNITPGSALVAEWSYNSSTGYISDDSSNVTVYNPWPTAVASGAWISFSKDKKGLLTVDNEACDTF